MQPPSAEPSSRNPDGVDGLVAAWQRHRDERARDQLIRQYRPFLWKQARRAARTWHLDPDDAYQAAAMGFIRALEDYDSATAALTTYGTMWCRSFIARNLIANRSAVTLPQSWHTSHAQVRKAARELQAAGIDPTHEAIAQRLGDFSVERVASSLLGAPTGSLDAPISDEAGATRLDFLRAPAEHRPDVLCEEASTAEAIRTAVTAAMATALTPRERQIATMRLIEEQGTPEIAEQLGVTRQLVSLTVQRAIAKMRAVLVLDDRVVGALSA